MKMAVKKNLDDFRAFLIENRCTHALVLLDQYRVELQRVESIDSLISDFMKNPKEMVERLEKHTLCFQP